MTRNWLWTALMKDLERDPVLRLTGIGLFLAHALTAYFWFDFDFLSVFSKEAWSSCYPIFPSCQEILSFGPEMASRLLFGYAACSFLGVYLFIRRATGAALWLLIILTLFKLLLFLGRYDLMGNYHLMHFGLIGAFFVLPSKRESLILVLCFFYFWAGLLKFNVEWLSGAALVARPVLQGELLSLALGYVPLLETFLVWGLRSQKLWLRSVTASQFFLFHAFSFHIVGYLYPLTMAFLLFPVVASLRKNYFLAPLSTTPLLTWAFVAVFSLINLWPKFGDDPALDGARRIVSLTMLDARAECRRIALIQDSKAVTFLSLPIFNRGIRVNCDHLVFEGELTKYCPHLDSGETLKYAHFSKRTTDSNYSLIRSSGGFCHEN